MEPSSTSNQHPFPFQDLVTITGFNIEEGLIGFAFADLDYHFHSKCSGDVGLRGSIRYESNNFKNRETTLNAN